jgi:hypothetical protein
MPRQTRINVKRVKINGAGDKMFCVTWPRLDGAKTKSGKPITRYRRFFKDKDEATQYLEQKKIEAGVAR